MSLASKRIFFFECNLIDVIYCKCIPILLRINNSENLISHPGIYVYVIAKGRKQAFFCRAPILQQTYALIKKRMKVRL